MKFSRKKVLKQIVYSSHCYEKNKADNTNLNASNFTNFGSNYNNDDNTGTFNFNVSNNGSTNSNISCHLKFSLNFFLEITESNYYHATWQN